MSGRLEALSTRSLLFDEPDKGETAMSSRVVILGVAEHVTAPTAAAENLEDIVFSAAHAALEASGLERDQIDAIVLSAADQTDGRAITSMLTAGPAGSYLNDEINIASSPGHAFATAWMTVLSGVARRVLLSSWGSASECGSTGGAEAAERLSMDPYFERHAMTPLALAAFQAAGQRRRPRGDDAARSVVARSAGNARDRNTQSERAGGDRSCLAYPLRSDEVVQPIDGAFSMVLAADDGEHGRQVQPVVVDAVTWRADAAGPVERDLVGLPHLRQAGADAYRRAGIDGAAGIDVFELHDYTPDAELLTSEALGLCGDGESPSFELDGAFRRKGLHPVNTLGGSLGGEAPFGGPLRKVVDAVRQLRGEAGAAQVPQARRALAQIAGGSAGQFQTVIILSDGVS
jgi:acetyl-CoA C-acetyltransferase